MLAGLALVGGILYMPSNYDALAYRTPRVLSWLAEKHWFWIPDARGWHNTRATGFEWLTAPILLLARSDRFLFLLNFVSFLLLPGLVYGLLHRLGVSEAPAWHWMWIFPSGLCFVLQAGSVANDVYGVILVLASIVFALRAKENQSVRDSFFLPSRGTDDKREKQQPAAAAAMVHRSFAKPPSVLAQAVSGNHCDWTRHDLFATSQPFAQYQVRGRLDWTEGGGCLDASPQPDERNRLQRWIALTSEILVPVFPIASVWNKNLPRIMPESWRTMLDGFAEGGWASYKLRELAGEEYTGLGCGVASCCCSTWYVVFSASECGSYVQVYGIERGLEIAADIVAVPGFSRVYGKIRVAAPSRLIAPYYGLFLPAVLCFSNSAGLVLTRAWRAFAWFSFGCAAVVLILSPARPLWPAQTIMTRLRKSSPVPFTERLLNVYSVYRERPDCFERFRKLIPESTQKLGLVAVADPETSLWRPFGSRRVLQVLRSTTQGELGEMDYVLVNLSNIKPLLGVSFEDGFPL